ncbi:MAG: CoA-binding protein [Ignavibacteriales bacterium]|nr:CoA-binding protein [Ignavibacteriales bacterium]
MDACAILEKAKKIAVIGISDKPDRDSGKIANYLARHDYDVVGVHPKLERVGEIDVYPSVSALPERVDIVDVFVRGDRLDSMIDEIVEHKPKTVWLQLGVHNDAAVEAFEKAGITVSQDRCIFVEHKNCFG